MFHTVILETERVGDFRTSKIEHEGFTTYVSSPLMLSIQESSIAMSTLCVSIECSSNTYGKCFISINVNNGESGRYKVNLISESGETTDMFSYFDIQFVTPYSVPSNAKMNILFPEKFAIGHRGNGSNKVSQECLENTLSALNAGYNKGARWAEFDVQLTKDCQPVIFHDFTLKSKTPVGNAVPLCVHPGYYEYAIADLTLDEFRSTGYDTKWNTPASSFREFLEKVPRDMGFDVEVKSIFEEPRLIGAVTFHDRNMIVDSILRTIDEFGGDRQLFFSSFDPMIIIMLALKGSRYPLYQLACQEEWESDQIAKDRVATLSTAYQHGLDVSGFVLDSEWVFENEKFVQKVQTNGFKIMTYGQPNSTSSGVEKLIGMGITGICTDDVSLVVQITN